MHHCKWAAPLFGCVIAVICDRGFAQANYHDMLMGEKRRTAPEVIPTQTMSHIFENLYDQPEKEENRDPLNAWKQYKENLRSLVAIQLFDSVQIGLDRIKFSPTKLQKGEIVEVNSHLAPKTVRVSRSYGYGIQMKVKLD